jgi:hypothetical protein
MASTSEQIRLGYEIGMREAADAVDRVMPQMDTGCRTFMLLRPVVKAMRDKVCETAGSSR